jgi:hypothetical protein
MTNGEPVGWARYDWVAASPCGGAEVRTRIAG